VTFKKSPLASKHAFAGVCARNYLIQLLCVASGWIATENYGNLREKDHAQHPAGRVGTPHDIAEIVLDAIAPVS
jgi:NAD(P)-dependent dehydrogenase (short-subunit alcohol dehydrogenase family)